MTGTILLIVLAVLIGLPLLFATFAYCWIKWLAPKFFRETRKMFNELDNR
jgi:hypothetical protein